MSQGMAKTHSGSGDLGKAKRARGGFGRALKKARRGAPAVALVGILGVATMGPALAGSSSASTTSTPMTPVTMSGLNASFKTQQSALDQRQQLELQRLDAYWAQRVTDRQAQSATDENAIRQAMANATAPVSQKRDSDLAAIEQARRTALAAIPGRYAAKRADRQAFVDQMQAQMPAKPHPLSYDQALIVRQQMQDQMHAEQAPIDAQQKADVAAVQAQLDAASAQRKTARAAVVVDQKAATQQIYDRYTQLAATRSSQLDDAVAALNAEQDATDSDYASTLAATKQLQADELAQAKATGADTKALQTKQKARLSELAALYKEQTSSISTEIKAAQTAAKTDLSTLSSQQKADLDALKDDAAHQLDQFDADTDALVLPMKQSIKDIQARYKEQKDDLKAAYDLKTAVAIRDTYQFSTSAAAVMALVDREQQDAVSNVNSAYDGQRDVVAAQAKAAITLLQAPFFRQISDNTATTKLDVSGLQAQGDAGRSALQRRQAREQLLLKSDFDMLKARASSYLADGASSLTPLENYYNPATDQGSLYNVAKGLGIGANSPTGQGVKVALIDTGVIDVDGLAQSNITIGPDFSFEDMNDPTRGHDTNGHGTHMAGIIVGRDNAWVDGNKTRTADRFLGMAPDAELISIKAGTADGSTDVSQVIAGINWVIRYNQENPGAPIRVINLSYGTDSQQDYSVDPLSYAVERAWKAGVVVVVAAGNDGWDANRLTDPASDPYVIAVGASQGAEKKVAAAYSSDGAQDRTVDLVAPGRSIVSLRNPGSWSDQFNAAGRADQRFVRGSGTSQAAAVTTGAVALLLQQRPDLTPDQVKFLLRTTATQVAAGDPRLTGAGALNVGKALGSHSVYAWQDFPASNGSGSLEASRGTTHVLADDGTMFGGEQDVFGMNYSSSGWADDSWSGSRWSGSRWSGSRWSAADWSGSRWSGSRWSGSRWSGSRWTGSRWSGSDWNGSRWSGSRWSSTGWAGSRWSGFGDF